MTDKTFKQQLLGEVFKHLWTSGNFCLEFTAEEKEKKCVYTEIVKLQMP